MQQPHVETTPELRWPDFYTVLKVSPQEDGEKVKKAINALYERANEFADHRDLSKRFYSQVLREKVLPQCRRILLDPTLRTAYDQQLLLHQQGSASAVSFTEFIVEVTKTQHVSTAFIYTGAEMSILPGFRTDKPMPVGQLQTEVRTSETVTMRMTSAPSTPAGTQQMQALPPATSSSPSPSAQPNMWAMAGAGVAILALLVGGAAMIGRQSQSTVAQAAPASAAAPAAVASGPPLPLINGDMSENQGEAPTGWEVSWARSGSARNIWDNKTFVSAPAALRVETSDKATDNLGGQLVPLVPTGSKTTAPINLTVSGVMKSDGHAIVSVGVQQVKNYKALDWQVVCPANNSTQWTRFSKTITLPAGIDQFQIDLKVNGQGSGWLDDVKVETAS